MKPASRKPVSDAPSPLSLEVRVQPRSGQRGLWKEAGGRLRAAVHAAPDGGKANEELVRLVADRLGVARSQVELWKGHRSRQKVLRIWGMEAAALKSILEAIE